MTSTVSPRRYVGDLVEVDLDRLAAEDVLDLHGPDLRGEVRGRPRSARRGPAASSPARCASRATARRPSGARRPARTGSRSAARPAGCRAGCAASSVGRAEHAHAVDAQVLLARVVVDERRSACSRARATCSISRITSWPASPAPTTITSLPRATSSPRRGRSKIVRASRREPATSASRSSQSMTAIRARQAEPCRRAGRSRRRGWPTSEATVTPRSAPHMSRVET